MRWMQPGGDLRVNQFYLKGTSPYQWTQFCWSVVFLIDMNHHLKICSFLEWFVYKYWKSESWLGSFPTVAYSGLEEWDAKYIKSRTCTFLWPHLFYSGCSIGKSFHRLYFAAVSIFVSRYELASPTLTGHNVENTQDYGYTQHCSAGEGGVCTP